MKSIQYTVRGVPQDLDAELRKEARATGRTLNAVVVGSCGCALFLGACGIANTPQQDLAYARWAQCNSSAQLERVDLDGLITFRFTSPEAGKRSCDASRKPTVQGNPCPRR